MWGLGKAIDLVHSSDSWHSLNNSLTCWTFS